MTSSRKGGDSFDGGLADTRWVPRARRSPRVDGVIPVRYEVKGDPNRKKRTREAPAPAKHARPITPLMTDGGTKFGLETDRELWHPEFNRLVDHLLELQRERIDPTKQPDPNGVPNMALPLPPRPRPYQRGLAGVLQDPATVDYTTRGFDAQPVAIVGIEGTTITFHFRDRAYVRLMRRYGTQKAWSGAKPCYYIHVEVKHREVYARGLREWMRTWLGYFSWLTTGEWMEVEGLRRIGWTTTQWHVNADFVGLEWTWEDSLDVTSVRKRTLFGKQGQDENEVEDDEDDEGWADAPPGFIQTFEFGRKSSDVLIVGYRKGDEQREAKGIDPAASAYAAWWRMFGHWNPKRDGDPFRVECKARKKGLIYRSEDDDEILYDFRDPALLLDDVAVKSFWQACTGRRRLVNRTAKKLRTCETDARWAIVQAAAGFEKRPEIRQLPHLVAQLTRDERVAKARRKFMDAAQDLALLEYGVGIDQPMDFAAVFHHFGDEVAARRMVVEGHGEGILTNAWSAEKALKRKPAQVEFFARELIDRHEGFEDMLLKRGGTGGTPFYKILDSQRQRPEQRRHDWREENDHRKVNPFDIPSPTDPPDG